MKLSYTWLKDLTRTRMSPEKLAEILNMHVASVENVEDLSNKLKKIVVGEIIQIKPHPKADRLKLATVKTIVGNKTKKFKVICGAKNIAVGQKVPLALGGARLADGSKLKTTVIRGVKSDGMLCAQDELGIGDDHEGIYILDPGTKLGKSITYVLGLQDVIFEIENNSISHRPDLFNHYGFAREISAINNLEFKSEKAKSRSERSSATGIKTTITRINKSGTKKSLNIKVYDAELCPRYMAVVMDNITVSPSPQWMQERLRSIGVRPINNVVDIGNYVMMERGQPLHVFDKEKISSDIIIRSAKKGEKLLALDEVEYELLSEDIVIADSKGPIAIAGVMGGESSGVSNSSKTIVIESANFNPSSVRRTSWRLGLRTDSALRFEKNLPLLFAETGMFRAIEFLQKIAHGRVVSVVYDIKSKEALKQLTSVRKIDFDFDACRKYIGINTIENKQMISILKTLGGEVTMGKNRATVSVPAHRTDLQLFEDLVEEIVRIYGIEKITPCPIVGTISPPHINSKYVLEKELKSIFNGCGFDEVYNYSFYDKEAKDNVFTSQKHRELINPLSAEQQYLRASLIPGLIKNAKKNERYFKEFKLFEMGNVFTPQEKKKVAGLMWEGKKDSVHKAYPSLYFSVKGVIDLVFKRIGVDVEKIQYRQQQPPVVERSAFTTGQSPKESKHPTGQAPKESKHPTGQASITDIVFGKMSVGVLGLYDGMGVFELDFDTLLRVRTRTKIYSPISLYPPIKRDMAFLIDKSIPWEQISNEIKNIDPLISGIDLFDIYESKRFGNKKNIAFHIIYQSDTHTLKSEEIDAIGQKIIKILQQKFNAKLRDF